MPDDGRDIVILSDLHMAAGYDPDTGTFDRNEDFFYDAAFGRFLDHLTQRASSEGRSWRLVILGDVVDFLQVEYDSSAEPELSAPEVACRKLDVIARGHQGFFEALGRFLDAGHSLDVVIGNHDIELIWEEVQERFRSLIAQHTSVDTAGRVRFHPWIFYVPGVVYAEHGQQYDRINSFTTLLRPFLPEAPDQIELPLGSFFVLYLFDYLEDLDPFADNVKPPTRYLAWALRTHPFLAVSTLGAHLRFFLRVIRKTSRLGPEERRARRREYWQKVVRPYAQVVGLPADVLEGIDRLAAVPANASRLRQLETLVLGATIPELSFLVALAVLYRLSAPLERRTRMITTALAAMGAIIWRDQMSHRPATQRGGYLLRAARNIHRLLSSAHAEVPLYVFGHTHQAEQFPLGFGKGGPRYMNTGTWTPLVPQTFDLLGTRERFSFVQITRNPRGAPVAQLLVWHDAANRTDPLLLM